MRGLMMITAICVVGFAGTAHGTDLKRLSSMIISPAPQLVRQLRDWTPVFADGVVRELSNTTYKLDALPRGMPRELVGNPPAGAQEVTIQVFLSKNRMTFARRYTGRSIEQPAGYVEGGRVHFGRLSQFLPSSRAILRFLSREPGLPAYVGAVSIQKGCRSRIRTK